MGWYDRGRYGGGGYYGFRPYVSVSQRIANAAKELTKLQKKGRTVSPIQRIEGRKIATTFWGEAWCGNLERYSDMSNRLPRGRAYVRNGSVVDLQIQAGCVTALVAGSELYQIVIKIEPLPAAAWKSIGGQCAGKIASIIELLSGKLSNAVMEIITHPKEGLFPKPAEIDMDCSCPDGASMCKHIAAVLYGIGRRLDYQPELFFLLRKVDHLELLQHAGQMTAATESTSGAKTLADTELADVFGIALDTAVEPEKRAVSTPPTRKKKSPAKVAVRSSGTKTKAAANKVKKVTETNQERSKTLKRR